MLLSLTFGCATPPSSLGKHPARLAVNLGIEHDRELETVQKALTEAGISWEQSAMSCNEAPLLINREDFQSAKAVATGAIIKNSLSIRLYESPSDSSLLEVWQRGRKVREEPHKLYNPSPETIDMLMAPVAKERSR
jgi:hypothetical protein